MSYPTFFVVIQRSVNIDILFLAARGKSGVKIMDINMPLIEHWDTCKCTLNGKLVSYIPSRQSNVQHEIGHYQVPTRLDA